MDDIKKAARAGTDAARKAVRDSDGHTTGDDVADVRDSVRSRVANAGDDLRRGARDAKREAE
jgi:hypothetical protein